MGRLFALAAAVCTALVFAGSAGASVQLLRLTSPVAAGSTAMLTADVAPRAVTCRISVSYKSGPSKAAGLSARRPPAAGRVSWSWKVGSSTDAGRWPIVVSCGAAGTLHTFIRVTGKDSSSGATTTGKNTGTVDTGRTVLLAPRTKTAGCSVGANPDRRCSPGAYYAKMTKAVLCSPSFRTGSVRDVPQSVKFDVEREYGMTPRPYGSTLEIDHIVSLEIGGSNDIANLFPEQVRPSPGYRVNDKLENKLHDLVCDGAMTLRAAQRGIVTSWQALDKEVFGVAP